jgi:type I restriction enzyme, S subunit
MKFEKLKNIVEVKKGKKPSFVEAPDENSVRVLQIDDLRNDSNPKYTNDRTGVLAKEDDVLIAWDGANAGTIGFGKSGYIGSTIALLRKKQPDLYSTTFIGIFLQSQYQYLRSKTTGATIPHISRKALDDLEVPVISVNDQLHIANLLSKAENLIAQRKESIRLLDEFLKSTFLEMFGDGKTNIKGFPFVKIEDISTEIKDGPHVSPKYSETGIPIFSSRNIKPGELVLEEIKYVSEEMYLELTKRFKPQRNDVLVTKGGTTGFAKVVDFDFPFCIWVHIAAIRPSEKVVPIYLEHYINSDYGYYQTQKNTKGAANRDLGLKKIAKIEMPLPPIELQTQFAQIVEKTETLKTQYQQCLQELENLYGSLSQKAFRGELSINKAVSV